MEFFDSQGRVCAICGVDEPRAKNWAIDHDHTCCPYSTKGQWRTCGECIRGILCGNCNRGIGQFQDDIDIMMNAVRYVEMHRKNR